MEIYRVGGSVRDELLGLPVVDCDFVVVGATPEAMTARGFKPVGRDFPVFLHPETHEEYALARTERKSGKGHQGFVFHADPGVSLESDLARRDLTINAMAQDDAGMLIDPHGGRRDLEARTLRHVSPAFAEDPLRVLRVARFAARFGFAVADETEALLRDIVASGELADLSPERVWREFSLGLVARRPSRMLSVLRRCGALAAVAPEIDALYSQAAPGTQPDTGVATAEALDRSIRRLPGAAGDDARLPVQFGILATHLSIAAAQSLAARIKASNDCRDAAVTAARHVATLAEAEALTAEQWLALLSGVDAQRRPERLDNLVAVARAWNSLDGSDFGRVERLVRGAAGALAAIDFRDLARDGDPPIAERAKALRLDALEAWLRKERPKR